MITEMRIAYHPGEYILEELRARGWSQAKFAELIGITKAEVNDLVKGRRNITARLAVRISEAFGTSADIWMKLQNIYDIYLVKKNKQEIREVSKISTRVLEFTSYVQKEHLALA
ncbi:MAG: HigA family addiction module antidote protein [Candidatus Peribacteria bacterium]|jgi:HTH-type transcriptional regulator/antitoxin HigA|nr:HigA family addiction module antidote protein [Candidatus Peribacteria bacterium]